MLGQKSKFAKECFDGNFIGTDFLITSDMTNKLPENWRDFNGEFIPVFVRYVHEHHQNKKTYAT
jgi:restriction system protein